MWKILIMKNSLDNFFIFSICYVYFYVNVFMFSGKVFILLWLCTYFTFHCLTKMKKRRTEKKKKNSCSTNPHFRQIRAPITLPLGQHIVKIKIAFHLFFFSFSLSIEFSIFFVIFSLLHSFCCFCFVSFSFIFSFHFRELAKDCELRKRQMVVCSCLQSVPKYAVRLKRI